MTERSSSVYLGSPLEAAHDAARIAYPLGSGPDGNSSGGDVMALRASMITDGPAAISAAERVLREATAARFPGGIEAYVDRGLTEMSQFLIDKEKLTNGNSN